MVTKEFDFCLKKSTEFIFIKINIHILRIGYIYGSNFMTYTSPAYNSKYLVKVFTGVSTKKMAQLRVRSGGLYSSC